MTTKTRNLLLGYCALAVLGIVYSVQRHKETGHWHYAMVWMSLGLPTIILAQRLWRERKGAA